MSLLDLPWNNASKLSVLGCFIYCTIAIILQALMIILFIRKVICRKNADNSTIVNNGLIYLCMMVLLLYFIITCNDMVCIIVYVLTEDHQQLQVYHFAISMEWNVAVMLQYSFFLYRLRLISTKKYRSKSTNIFFIILCIIEIIGRIIVILLFDEPFLGLAIITIYILIVSIFLLYIFYRYLTAVMINNEQNMVRDKLSMDDGCDKLERTMNAVRLSIGYGQSQKTKINEREKVIEIFCEIFVLLIITVILNQILGVIATIRWYDFDDKTIFWIEGLWIMDITAQVINSLSVFLQFKSTIPYYFRLCNPCHKCVKRRVKKWVLSDINRFSVNRQH